MIKDSHQMYLQPKWKFEFFEFSDVQFNLTWPGLNLTLFGLHHVIIFYASSKKIPKIFG